MNPNLTEIAYILDRSGSMASVQQAAIDGFNDFLQGQLDTPGDARLTLVLFDDEYLVPVAARPLEEVPRLDERTYVPRNSTALLDAIGETIDTLGWRLAATPEPERPGKVIVAIYTDGLENASQRHTWPDIAGRIRHQRDRYNWEFIFLGANQDAIATASRLSIARHLSSDVGSSGVALCAANRAMSRKVSSLRQQSMGIDHLDLDTPMSKLVAEECESMHQEDEERRGE